MSAPPYHPYHHFLYKPHASAAQGAYTESAGTAGTVVHNRTGTISKAGCSDRGWRAGAARTDPKGRKRGRRHLGFNYRDAAAIVNPALLAKLPQRLEPGGQGLLWPDETDTTHRGTMPQNRITPA